jgi:F-type H+-transporting ATPase subunit a
VNYAHEKGVNSVGKLSVPRHFDKNLIYILHPLKSLLEMDVRQKIAEHTGLGLLRPGLMALCFLLALLALPAAALADDQTPKGPEKAFDPGKVIIDHVLDAYDWHIADIGDLHISLPLPVILFYEGRGYFFFSHRFEHGYASYKGFRIADYGPSKGRIVKVLDDGKTIDPHASFLLDLSITKNVISLFIAGVVLCLVFISVARRYQRDGSQVAPRGLQSFLEPIILFVRDEIALPSIGKSSTCGFCPTCLPCSFSSL